MSDFGLTARERLVQDRRFKLPPAMTIGMSKSGGFRTVLNAPVEKPAFK